nr:RecName: Full=Uncharacterized 19.3 kDa protein in dapB 3'region; AltName: Full=ORF Z [Mycobacterium tuberculosis variant bovis]AAA21563.1 ORF z [Mycobacterium tuberculosis variant bovis]
MAALLVLYIVLVAQRAWLLLISGQIIGVAMGVALIVLPVIAGWALWRELAFGRSAERLARPAGGRRPPLPSEEMDVRVSGRPDRAQADAVFPHYRHDVEAHPTDWRAWFRLGLAYDGAGDRRRAREAIRRAITLEKNPPTRWIRPATAAATASSTVGCEKTKPDAVSASGTTIHVAP